MWIYTVWQKFTNISDEGGGSTFLKNTGNCVPDYMVSHTTTQESS
jgi:hypothetical protein